MYACSRDMHMYSRVFWNRVVINKLFSPTITNVVSLILRDTAHLVFWKTDFTLDYVSYLSDHTIINTIIPNLVYVSYLSDHTIINTIIPNLDYVSYLYDHTIINTIIPNLDYASYLSDHTIINTIIPNLDYVSYLYDHTIINTIIPNLDYASYLSDHTIINTIIPNLDYVSYLSDHTIINTIISNLDYASYLSDHSIIKTFFAWWNSLSCGFKVRCVFIYDNVPSHKAMLTREIFERKKVTGKKIMEWPPSNSDLHPIENLWSIGKMVLYESSKQYNTKANLWEAIKTMISEI